MSTNQFTGNATQPQCNRKFCQFNKDQYCISTNIPGQPKTNWVSMSTGRISAGHMMCSKGRISLFSQIISKIIVSKDCISLQTRHLEFEIRYLHSKLPNIRQFKSIFGIFVVLLISLGRNIIKFFTYKVK